MLAHGYLFAFYDINESWHAHSVSFLFHETKPKADNYVKTRQNTLEYKCNSYIINVLTDNAVHIRAKLKTSTFSLHFGFALTSLVDNQNVVIEVMQTSSTSDIMSSELQGMQLCSLRHVCCHYAEFKCCNRLYYNVLVGLIYSKRSEYTTDCKIMRTGWMLSIIAHSQSDSNS